MKIEKTIGSALDDIYDSGIEMIRDTLHNLNCCSQSAFLCLSVRQEIPIGLKYEQRLSGTVMDLQSYINIIDEVLIPPSGAQAAPLPISAGNTAAAFGPAPSIAEQAEAAQGFAPTAGISTVGK